MHKCQQLTKLQISPSSKWLISSVYSELILLKRQPCSGWQKLIGSCLFPSFLYLGPRIFGITSGENLKHFRKMQRLYLRTLHFLLHFICFNHIMLVPKSTSILNLQLSYICTFWFKYISNVSVSLLLLQINRISQKDGWHFCCYRNWSWCYTACLSPICHTSIQLLNTDIFLFHKELQ